MRAWIRMYLSTASKTTLKRERKKKKLESLIPNNRGKKKKNNPTFICGREVEMERLGEHKRQRHIYAYIRTCTCCKSRKNKTRIKLDIICTRYVHTDSSPSHWFSLFPPLSQFPWTRLVSAPLLDVPFPAG